MGISHMTCIALQVYYYAEVNRVVEAMNNASSLAMVNTVLPKV
jgi:hypothetical protein